MYFTAVVNVPTPGTPVNLFAAISSQLPQLSGALSGALDVKVSGLMFQAAPGNTAAKNMYFGNNSMNVATPKGIGGALLPGAFSPWQDFDGTMVSLKEIVIDADAGTAPANMYVTVIA